MTDLRKAADLYHPATFILIEGLKSFGVEGERILHKWDEARQFLDDKALAVSKMPKEQSSDAPPEQDPVDWEAVAADQAMTIAMLKLQKSEWVGLTDDELPEGATYEFDRGVRWAEAKLKEKNNVL
jgi:hypothetical protein